MFTWGIISVALSAVQSIHSLLVLRLLLGIAEGTSPLPLNTPFLPLSLLLYLLIFFSWIFSWSYILYDTVVYQNRESGEDLCITLIITLSPFSLLYVSIHHFYLLFLYSFITSPFSSSTLSVFCFFLKYLYILSSSSALAGLVGGLTAYGILHMDGVWGIKVCRGGEKRSKGMRGE